MYWLMLLLLTYGTLLVVADHPEKYATDAILEIVKSKSSYNKNVIPLPENQGPLLVTVSMHIRNVVLDEKNMKMKTNMKLKLRWKDNRLKFIYKGVSRVRLSEISHFWLPDIAIQNAENIEDRKSGREFIKINSEGEVFYSKRFLVESKCPMSFLYFPFDFQMCKIELASDVYNREELNFAENSSIEMSDRLFPQNPILIDFKTLVNNTELNAKFVSKFLFQRKFKNYVFRWYIPTMICVTMAFLSVILPPKDIISRLGLTLLPIFALVLMNMLEIHNPVPVSFVTSLDVFCGVSFIAVFAVLIHVLLAYVYSSKFNSENDSVAEVTSKFGQLWIKIRRYLDHLIKSTIIIGYVLFVVIYFSIERKHPEGNF